MSAFLCSAVHINTLVSYAKATETTYYYRGSRHKCATPEECQRVAGLLYTANMESINERYRKDEASDEFQFKPEPLPGKPLQPVVILKLCNCFDYQACEVENYDTTIARCIIQAIKDEAVRRLPGYEDAPWSL